MKTCICCGKSHNGVLRVLGTACELHSICDDCNTIVIKKARALGKLFKPKYNVHWGSIVDDYDAVPPLTKKEYKEIKELLSKRYTYYNDLDKYYTDKYSKKHFFDSSYQFERYIMETYPELKELKCGKK